MPAMPPAGCGPIGISMFSYNVVPLSVQHLGRPPAIIMITRLPV